MGRQLDGNVGALCGRLTGVPQARSPERGERGRSLVNDPGTMTDSEIVRRVVGGDREAFSALVKRHGALVQRTVARHVPRDRAEDLVQESFIRAFQSLANFQLGSKFPEWLATITVRTCYDYWRSHYRSRERAESTLTEQHRDWADRVTASLSQEQFDEEVRRKEAREVLDYALGTLSPDDRMVVTLVHLEGLSIEEAAQQMDWTAVNVKVRAHRARRRMRQALEALLGENIEGLWNAKIGTARS